jgi:hypothetical protein
MYGRVPYSITTNETVVINLFKAQSSYFSEHKIIATSAQFQTRGGKIRGDCYIDKLI